MLDDDIDDGECFNNSFLFLRQIEEDSSDLLKNISLVLLIIIPLYTFLCVGIFLYYRKSYYWLYRRNFTMLACFVLGVLSSLFPNVWRLYQDPTEFPCASLIIGVNLELGFFLLTFITRLTTFFLRVNFNRALLRYNFRALQDGSFLHRVAIGSDDFVSTDQISQDTWVWTCWTTVLFQLLCWRNNPDVPKELRFRCFLSSHRVSNIFFIVFFFALFCLAFLDEALYLGCNGCTLDDGLLPALFFTIIIFLFGVCLLTSNSSVPDGLGIKHEMSLIAFCALFIESIGLVLYLLYSDFEVQGIFAWSLLSYLSVICTLTISFPYQVYLAKHQYTTKFEDAITLEEVLRNEEGSKAFALYLGSTLCVENFYFYKAVMRFKGSFKGNDKDTLALAQAIYSLYIDSNGKQTINLPYTIRESIKEEVEDENIVLEVFDSALHHVVHLLEGDVFHRFKRTKYYQAFKGNLDATDI